MGIVSNWRVPTREGLPPTAESRNFILSHQDQCAGFNALLPLWSIIFRRPQVMSRIPHSANLPTRRLGFWRFGSMVGAHPVPIGVVIPINMGERLPIAARQILHPVYDSVGKSSALECRTHLLPNGSLTSRQCKCYKGIPSAVLPARPETILRMVGSHILSYSCSWERGLSLSSVKTKSSFAPF